MGFDFAFHHRQDGRVQATGSSGKPILYLLKNLIIRGDQAVGKIDADVRVADAEVHEALQVGRGIGGDGDAKLNINQVEILTEGNVQASRACGEPSARWQTAGLGELATYRSCGDAVGAGHGVREQPETQLSGTDPVQLDEGAARRN